jgi:hypothetical protein
MIWRWKQFLLVWLVVFLLAPSIWIHKIFMLGARPACPEEVTEPLFIPFGAVYFGRQILGQFVGGDFGDSLLIFVGLILPIIIYTGILSVIIYYCYRKIRQYRIKTRKAGVR